MKPKYTTIPNKPTQGGLLQHGPQMEPQTKKALFRLKELAKDPKLNYESKQSEANKIIKEYPKIVQVLKWVQSGNVSQQRSLRDLGFN